LLVYPGFASAPYWMRDVSNVGTNSESRRERHAVENLRLGTFNFLPALFMSVKHGF
jgi:hypothetical protein